MEVLIVKCQVLNIDSVAFMFILLVVYVGMCTCKFYNLLFLLRLHNLSVFACRHVTGTARLM